MSSNHTSTPAPHLPLPTPSHCLQSPLSLEQRVVAYIASYPALPDVMGWAEELMRQCISAP
jgi:hypothetical protein